MTPNKTLHVFRFNQAQTLNMKFIRIDDKTSVNPFDVSKFTTDTERKTKPDDRGYGMIVQITDGEVFHVHLIMRDGNQYHLTDGAAREALSAIDDLQRIIVPIAPL